MTITIDELKEWITDNYPTDWGDEEIELDKLLEKIDEVDITVKTIIVKADILGDHPDNYIKLSFNVDSLIARLKELGALPDTSAEIKKIKEENAKLFEALNDLRQRPGKSYVIRDLKKAAEAVLKLEKLEPLEDYLKDYAMEYEDDLYGTLKRIICEKNKAERKLAEHIKLIESKIIEEQLHADEYLNRVYSSSTKESMTYNQEQHYKFIAIASVLTDLLNNLNKPEGDNV